MDESSRRLVQVDGDGAAKRRRLRRLRSWWRQEQQTVAAVLATVSHHSYPKVDTAHDGLRAQRTVTSTREGVEHVTHGGLRAQKPPLPGKRPGVLLDPDPVQVVDAVTSYVAAPGPSSLVPRLAANDPQVSRGSRVAGPKGAGGRAEKERGGGEEAEEGLAGTAHGRGSA